MYVVKDLPQLIIRKTVKHFTEKNVNSAYVTVLDMESLYGNKLDTIKNRNVKNVASKVNT